MKPSLGHLETWNEDAIQNRAAKLADIGVVVWLAPKLPQDLDAYRSKTV